MDNALDVRKALDTGAGTTGAVLIPKIISEGIRMFVETRAPLYTLIDKVPWDTNAYIYKEQNGLPVASFGAELGALPAAQSATYVERTVPIKSVYIRSELSGQVIDATRNFVNVLQREINNSALGMARTLELKIVAGDSVANPNEFDGLAKWITTTVYRDTTSDGLGTAQALRLADMDLLIDAAPGGEPTHLIMSKGMHRKLWSILQSQVRFIDGNMTTDGGFRVPAYATLPIIRLFDNASILANTILAPDMNFVYMPVLRDITYEELAKTRDSIDYFLRMYCALVVEGASRYHAKLVGAATAIA